ncbi:TonB-dependent receptor [Pedobacter endophyticus]|uniref:TonB-dependent receptor n=1 Tax=Pedobacter endophyticus TaxID=2789740 RepID=A0A7S9L2S1_9SPHI|nr:TonB-dependent receptor [Pedobacter endophyticus]QPH41430.1 TonB-dependent receptor [Pedobacter endophyticus]
MKVIKKLLFKLATPNLCPNHKLFKIVKLTFILIIFALTQVRGEAHSQNISLYETKATLRSVLESIKRQSGYLLLYQDQIIQKANPVTINKQNISVKEALDYCFKNQPLTYQIIENTIIVKPKKELPKNTTAEVVDADIDIQGKIVDENNKYLPGASIKVKGTDNGTSSNSAGEYSLKNVPDNATLVVSYLGYVTREVSVKDNFKLIQLQPLNNDLNEVVVVGYGTQTKAKVTGSISQVEGKELVKSPVANLSNSLIGRLPGLRATQRSGEPGNDGSGLDIRGFGNALVIIDGVPGGSFNQLDANEIETFSIIKDASAAVYGVRAANGVVLVTTKKGKLGEKPKIELSSYYGFQTIAKYPELADAALFTELYNEAAVNTWVKNGNPTAPLTFPYPKEVVEDYRDGTLKSYDWFNETIKKNAPQRYTNINVSGATDKVNYFINLGNLFQDGMWRSGSTNFKRYNLRGKVEAKIAKRFTAAVNLSGRLENLKFPGVGAASLISGLSRTYPIYPFYANDNPNYPGNTNATNQLFLSDAKNSGYTTEKTKTYSAIFSLDYEVPYIDGLNIKALYSYENQNYDNKAFTKKFQLYNYNATDDTYNVGYTGNDPSRLSNRITHKETKVSQISINYKNTFGEKHNVSGLLLYESQEVIGNSLSAYREFILSGVDELFAGVSANQSNSGSSYEEAKLGYVGRVNYDYAGKYLVEFAARYDGTYKVKAGSRFGFFPSVSAGWVISKENFMENQKTITNLKLRASYGRVGDDYYIDPFQYLTGFNYPSGSYVFGLNPIPGLSDKGLANELLTWYTSKTANFGVDVTLWSGLLGIEFDYFYRQRDDLLGTRVSSLPNTFGASLPQENINGDNTRGFELALTHRNRIGDFNYSVAPNLSMTRTKNGYIERAPSTSSLNNYYNNTTNRWTNRTVGYVAIGQFQNQEDINNWAIQDGRANQTLLPGDIKYEDLNGDGVIDGLDQTVIGRGTTPEIFFGLNLTAGYKNFDFSLLLQGATNFNADYTFELLNPLFNGASAFKYFEDRWRRADLFDPNSAWIPGKYPSTIISGTANNQRTSSFWLKDATYLRVKNFELGYTLPQKLLAKVGLNKLRFYASGQNVFTFDKIKYIDPEAPSGRGNFYPQQKSWVFGVNVGL